jgi:hypothetical protein
MTLWSKASARGAVDSSVAAPGHFSLGRARKKNHEKDESHERRVASDALVLKFFKRFPCLFAFRDFRVFRGYFLGDQASPADLFSKRQTFQ